MSANERNEALEAIAAYRDPRYYKLDRLERFVETTQYEGLSDWWSDKPIFEKAPNVVYPIVDEAIKSNVDLLFGEGRFPTVSAAAGEDTSDEEDGATKGDGDQLESLLRQVARQVRFKTLCRESFAQGQATGTSVTIYGIRGGKLFSDSAKSKWCNAKFDVDGNVTELEIRYGFLDQVKIDGKWKCVGKLYRRVITTDRDVTYHPALADKSGAEPKWKADPEQTFDHGLGFCPVVWYRHDRGCAAVNEIDGRAIHRLALSEIVAHDYSLSQRNRVALMSEPQPYEIGVPADHNPTQSGRTADVSATLAGGEPSTMNPIVARYGARDSAAPARKKGPGFVWRYPSPETKVGYLTVPSGALDAIDNDARDLKIKIAESMSVVFLDPEQIKVSSISGRALRALKQRQLDRCDQYREDVEDGFIQPALWMLLRLAVKASLPGSESVARAFPDIMTTRPMFEVKWGPYFDSEPDEELNTVRSVVEVGEYATLRQKVERLSGVFGTTDVDEIVSQIEDERLTRQIEAEEAAIAVAKKRERAGATGDKSTAQPGAGSSNGAQNGDPSANG